MKWVGVGILLMLSFVAWVAIATGEVDWKDAEDWGFALLLAIGAPVGAGFTLRHILRTPANTPLKKLLADIPSATETICPFCNMPMVLSSEWKCSGCGVERLTLPIK